jgi:hypothetical protein
MPEVHRVTVTVRRPKDSDPGQVTFGYYTLVDGILTMTDASGMPMRRTSGEYYRAKIGPDESPQTRARVFTREIRAALRGSDFNRPLDYSKFGGIA